MDPMTTGILIGLGIGLVVGAVLGYVLASGQAGPIGGAAKLRALAAKAKQDPNFLAKLDGILAGAELKPVEPPKPPKPSGAPLRMLVLLQAEARLVDFLMEEIGGASDAQIGQAVREIHRKARTALQRHAVIEPVLGGSEGDAATVPKGFDPSAVRVVGNVTGEPPFSGAINHPGWRVKELKLAPPPEGTDEFVLQPAEVQVA
jgi:hypothetical protein